MKFLRVEISSWTASFRQPLFISGVQPSFPVPPPSTIYGLISAVKGELVNSNTTKIGFFFQSSARSFDLERIYEVDQAGKGKANIYRREFLFDNKLTLFLTDITLEKYFRNPYYPVLLGRSNDLATINKIEIVETDDVDAGKVLFTIVPRINKIIEGELVRLPVEISDEIPRIVKKSNLFFYVQKEQKIQISDLDPDRKIFKDPKSGYCFFLIS